MLEKKVEEALNSQINAEIFSAYLYLSMAAWFQCENLDGFASWMNKQAQEEWAHAMKIFHYVDERGGRVRLEAIEKPQADWKSPLQAFEDALEHERHISGRIHKLVELARAQADTATEIFLQWFVTEQVEEEASVDKVVEHLKMVADSRHGLFMMNRELGAR